MQSNVYFISASSTDYSNLSKKALTVFKILIAKDPVKLETEIPIKIHAGEPGNTSYIKPEAYNDIITYLKKQQISPYFVETTTSGGPRSTGTSHSEVAKKHGFTQIPFMIADGENGTDDVDVSISTGKYFKTCKIAKKLAEQNQVLVASHFKGHIMSGFGGAIKMLALGFASRQGKQLLHSKRMLQDKERINWSDSANLYHGSTFRFRTAEYALAASQGKKHIHLLFALQIVDNCDCDGVTMKPVYKDLGIFASTDPVAIDKACFDMLTKREGKKPFEGDEIFAYAEKIGLGSQKYTLIKLT